MSTVFISYSKEDLAAARTVAGALENAGFSVWWDRHIPPGKTWDEIIGRALDGSSCVLVLWSGTSIESRWVREEAERAASRGCLIPVLIEKVEPPFGFGRIQAADLSGWHGDQRDPEFADLLRAVSELMQAAPKQPTPLPTAPRPGIPKPQPSKIRSRLLWFAVGAVAVGAAGYVVSTYIRVPRPEPRQLETAAVLPNVVGLPLAEARRLLESAGFPRIIEGQAVSATDPAGTVAQQDPVGGTRLPKGSAVRVVLAVRPPSTPPAPRPVPVPASTPPATPVTAVLPNVVGLPFSEAGKRLASRGFTNIRRTGKTSTDVAADTVLEQDPLGGTRLPKGTSVRLVLAARPAAAPGAAGAPPQGFRVVKVSLRADPRDYSGPCPVKISFSGRISVVGGQGTVSYKFLRSDRFSAPVESLTFDSPGSKTVATSWRLGALTPRFQPFSGWQAIQILEPQAMKSDKAAFRINCQ